MLERVPLWAQILIVIVGVGVFCFLIDLLMFSDIRTQAERDEKEAQKIDVEVRELENVRVQLNDYKKKIEEYMRDLQAYRVNIPEEVRLSETLAQLQNIARSRSAVVREFRPGNVQKRDFYYEKTVNVKAGTTYDQIGQLFADIAALQRIVKVSDVEIRQASAQTPKLTIEATYQLTTFFASEKDILGDEGEQK
ncbi:type 4a pilus biogenesis protein PilO [Chloracidobacterium validum]|uniref:Type 4a pilus biogenesis protein PilO n=1 Tax=Chloracidobacterium validum TaxID=2821543 RepID=A0ABX8B6J5_9BACT|nr:type 4a pilus biogenesis protein PilO [Chloracidobacterium validum]QUW02589.1 type 4a pilus biogenesis protein PilO [Chloracidobacterium validum]